MSELAIAVLGRSAFTLGFELSGVRVVVNTTSLDAASTTGLLFDTLKRQDIGVLIIEDKTLAMLSAQDRTSVENYIRPVVVVLSETASDPASLRRQITRAIGVDVYEH